MTDPSSVAAPSSTAPAAPQKASFWEDLIDIFFSPANVFRRNQDKSVWPPLLFVSLAIGVIFFATFNQLAADLRRRVHARNGETGGDEPAAHARGDRKDAKCVQRDDHALRLSA